MKTIYLIRHGQSEANANPELYLEKGRFDHTFCLTPKGIEQANECGKNLKIDGDFTVFVSPYQRAQETWMQISKSLHAPKDIITDVRIREQEFKDFETAGEAEEKKARAKARGKLFYRYKHAESGSDALNRVGNFYNQLRMDMMLGNRTDNVVIVCHEIIIRCFLTIMEDLPPQVFDTLDVPNCQIITLEAGSNLKFKRV